MSYIIIYLLNLDYNKLKHFSKWNLNLVTNNLENKDDGFIFNSFFMYYKDWYIF